MKNLNKLALSVALAAGTSVAAAGTITGTSETVGAEMSANGYLDLDTTKGVIAVSLANAIRANDELVITLSGAEFAGGQGDWWLIASDAASLPAGLAGAGVDADDWNFFEATSTQLTFIASGNIAQSAANIFYLSSSNVTDIDEVFFDLPEATAGTSVTLTAATTGTDTFTGGANIFGYVNEFAAAASGGFDAVIDAISGDRVAFVGGGSDAMDVTFTTTAAANSIALDGDDTVILTLQGDMTGIGSVIIQEAAGGAGNEYAGVISLAGDTATVRASANIMFDGDAVLEITPDASVVMAPREFEVAAVLDLDDEESTKTLFSGSDAGELTINGASGRVAQMSLNFGFVQWVKVANRATEPAAIEVDITVDGVTYDGLALKSVPALSVATISGAEIEAALATAGGPTTGVDATLLFTVPVAPALVDFHSEKKGTDGRTITNVE